MDARPKLVIDVQHGLANRLRAMASAAALAAATGRQLVVVWRPDHHCGALLRDLVDFDGLVIEDDSADFLRSRAQRVYNYMEIEPGSAFNEPVLHPDERLTGDVYVRSAYTLKSPLADGLAENRFLRRLRPQPWVRERVLAVPRPSQVAVHVRMGTGPQFDHLPAEGPENWPVERHKELTEWRRKSDVSRFLARLETLDREGLADTVFVAADLPSTYEALKARFGTRVRYQQRNLFDRSTEQLESALADMILLTAAPLFLRSTWSSFSDVAQRLARPNRRCELSGTDF